MYIKDNSKPKIACLKVYNRLAIGYTLHGSNGELEDKMDKYVSIEAMASNKTLIASTLVTYTNEYNKASWEEILLEALSIFTSKVSVDNYIVLTHDITYDIYRAILQYNTLQKEKLIKFPFLVHNLITNLLIEGENPLSMDTYLRHRIGVEKFNSLNTLEGSPSTVCNLIFHTWNISKQNLG